MTGDNARERFSRAHLARVHCLHGKPHRGPRGRSPDDGRLDDQALHWLQTNFLKTELEPGHCLRLPAEGPCECELMVSCPKFLTTTEYAPRLRERMEREEELVANVEVRGWPREVERHQATKRRIKQLLDDLGSEAGSGSA